MAQLLKHVPDFSVASAEAIAEEQFGIRGRAQSLPSERDQNFLVTDSAGEKFVLKIANGLESRAFLEAENAVLKHVGSRVSFCQSPVSDWIVNVGIATSRVWFDYLPGVPLAKVQPASPELLRDLGRKLGQLDQALSDFDHPAVHRDFHWDLANGNRIIDEFADKRHSLAV